MDTRVREMFAHINSPRLYCSMGNHLVVESGITDEGDRWYAYDKTHIAIDKSGVHLFVNFEKALTAPSIEEMHSQIVMWDSLSHYSDKITAKKTVKVEQ